MLFWVSLQEPQYSHILVVPVVSALLLFRQRGTIFATVEVGCLAGLGLLVAGALLDWFWHRYSVSPSENDQPFIRFLRWWLCGLVDLFCSLVAEHSRRPSSLCRSPS